MTREYKAFFKNVGGNEGDKCKYPVRMDTYGCGCAHDCKYCYAKSLLAFRKLWNPRDPSVADIGKLRKQIDKIAEGKCGNIRAIRLGGMTDCFQPEEALRHVTYETLKYLKEKRVPYLIVTKSDLVADDEYLEVLDKELAHIQITVTTTDDSRSLTYEKADRKSVV